MKKCFKCGKEKPISEFYKHSRMTGGHLNKCKECSKKEAIDNYNNKVSDPTFRESEKARGRNKYRRLYVGQSKADSERSKRYMAKYPEKDAAKNYSANLVPPFEKAERHHWNYNEDFFKDVIWLIKKDHMKAHRFIVYDQERKMYRRIDTNELLDTKARHEKYIRWCIKTKED